MEYGYLIKSFICFLVVYLLYKYDIWWKKNKIVKRGELLNDYDKTVRPVKNLALKIMVFILGLLFLIIGLTK